MNNADEDHQKQLLVGNSCAIIIPNRQSNCESKRPYAERVRHITYIKLVPFTNENYY